MGAGRPGADADRVGASVHPATKNTTRRDTQRTTTAGMECQRTTDPGIMPTLPRATRRAHRQRKGRRKAYKGWNLLAFGGHRRLARHLSYKFPEMEAHGPNRGSKGGWVPNTVGSPITHSMTQKLQSRGRTDTMKKFFAVVMSAAMVAGFAPVAQAQSSCPAEVAEAKAILSKKSSTARAQDVQAPRSLAGARQEQAPRGQDVQAPRGQDVQAPRGQRQEAPRGQDVQAPRGQEAPRGQDVQAPRGQDVQAPRGQRQEAPRGQDVQAPRGQEAPRGQDVQAPRSLAGSQASGSISKAAQLVKDAEAACKAGDNKTAKDKATEALSILR